MGDPGGKWETIGFDDFLTKCSPQLRIHILVCHQFPPFHILNEELLSGGQDQGMSGGCFWKPFQLSEDEYQAIREEMLTNPKLNLEFDLNLAEKPNIKKWCGAVITKYNPRRKGRDNAI